MSLQAWIRDHAFAACKSFVGTIKPVKAPGWTQCLGVVCSLCFISSTLLRAQIPFHEHEIGNDEKEANSISQDSLGGRVRCAGERISEITILPQPPFAPPSIKLLSHAARFFTSFHVTTKKSVIQRYLALEVGDNCTELRRLESERILRAQPYLADARIDVLKIDSQTVALTVNTVDELSLIVGGQIVGKSPVVKEFMIGESNFGGRGMDVAVGWQYSEGYRDAFKARFTHYQLFGRPYHFSAEGHRKPLGSRWELQASHPYITDLQRVSWRITLGVIDGYQEFLRQHDIPASLPLRREYSDIGGLYAFGPPGKLWLVGASVSRERESTGLTPMIVSDTGMYPDTSSILFGRYGEYKTSRVNLLLGYRDINLVRVTGFDALEGAQDIRNGLQISTLVGKGIRMIDGADDDYFASVGVYYGKGTPAYFFGVEATSERRRDVSATEWDGILATSRIAWYYKPRFDNTLVSSLEFGGGWRQRVPFQLTFRDRHGGLRGFGRSDLAGGQRLVLRLEDRMIFGRVRDLASWGGAAFVDAGKIWAGDVPFGVTTGLHSSVGISLLAAIPPHSRRLWRLDLAMPVTDRKRSRFEIRIRAFDNTRLFWREPDDVQAGRERSVPNSVYNWP